MQDTGANVLRDAEECLPVSPGQSPKQGDVNPLCWRHFDAVVSAICELG